MNDQFQKIVVTGILYHEDKVLVIRRGTHETFLPGAYEFPGGKVDFGEQPDEALIREFKEEVQLDINVNQPIATFAYTSENNKRHTVEIFYKVNPINTPTITLSNDHDDYKFISSQELNTYITGFPEKVLTAIRNNF